MNFVRYADRDDLRAIRFRTLSRRTFPEYMNHNVPGDRYWGRLYDEHPDFQLALLENDGKLAHRFASLYRHKGLGAGSTSS